MRLNIYRFVFQQPDDELLGLSREPPHNYSNGPPDNWTADSRQQGLVYNSDRSRAHPTNSRFLRTCRTIRNEATPVFYGTNKINLYAEDNNDIFYWLLDIGKHNRRSIRRLEIGWAYGVEIQSARNNVYSIIEKIDELEPEQEQEKQNHRNQLIEVVQKLETNAVRLIIRTLNLLAENQDLVGLTIYLPGEDGGDIWDIPNDNLYFQHEIFSNTTRNVYACIPEGIRKIIGIKTLTIGYTKDIELAEEIAKDAGAEELIIRVHPLGDSLTLSQDERNQWVEKGWRLDQATAYKKLARDH